MNTYSIPAPELPGGHIVVRAISIRDFGRLFNDNLGIADRLGYFASDILVGPDDLLDSDFDGLTANSPLWGAWQAFCAGYSKRSPTGDQPDGHGQDRS